MECIGGRGRGLGSGVIQVRTFFLADAIVISCWCGNGCGNQRLNGYSYYSAPRSRRAGAGRDAEKRLSTTPVGSLFAGANLG